MVGNAVICALKAVMEAFFAVAVGVDDLTDAVVFSHLREDALFFKDVRRRVVQEHDELLESRAAGGFERDAQAFGLAADEFFGMGLVCFIPAETWPARSR